jgi:hypothetical protein
MYTVDNAIAEVEKAAHNLADLSQVEDAAFLRGCIDGLYTSQPDQGYMQDRGSVKVCYLNGFKAGRYSSKWEKLPVTLEQALNI